MASNQDVYVKIIAQDGASETFRKIGTTAQTTGNQISQSAAKASRDWTDASRKIGAAVGLVGGMAIRANNASEASQARLKASIEATGKSYDQFAVAIDKASKNAIQLAFDDEDAADAIATLTQATNDAQRAIDDLSLAEDIARARKIDLAAATNIVVAAEEGRYGALARMGIQIDANASREEALAAIQERVAGQAQAYADTNAAAWDRWRIAAENALESVGGKLADYQAEIFAASAAWTAFGGAITAGGGALLGAVGATEALGAAIAALGPAALVAGPPLAGLALYYEVTAKSAKRMADETQRVKDTLDAIGQQQGSPTAKLLEFIRLSGQEGLYQGAYGTARPVPINSLLGPATHLSKEDIAAVVVAVQQSGMDLNRPSSITTEQYGWLASMILDLRSDEVRKGLMAQTPSAGALGGTPSGTSSGSQPWQHEFDQTRVDRAAATYPMAQDFGPSIQDLQKMYGAYYNVADGAATATDALEAFNTVQAHIDSVESRYSGQLSEYNSQLGSLDAAIAEVNAKKESGAKLSAQEQQLLDGETAARERLTGGVYDSTLQLGLQAEAYADNMSAADSFKQGMSEASSSTTMLSLAIRDMILALDGIPPEVKTKVLADTSGFWAEVNGIPTHLGDRYLNVYANPIGFGGGSGSVPLGMNGLTMFAGGGVSSGGYAIVGEVGPEIVHLNRGEQVIPAPATASRREREGGHGGNTIHIHIHGGMYVTGGPNEIADWAAASAIGSVRR